MACRKRYVEELGRPHRLLRGGSVGGGYTAIEARKGKPGNGTMPEPQLRRGTRVRQAEEYGERERPPDTVGSEARKPTSLRGIADKAKADKQHRFRDLYGCLNVELLLDCWSDLNKDAASGVDGVTWQGYAENLQANVEALVERLKKKRYRAKLIRRHYIPKGNGQERPLGIPVIEDKLLQAARARLLNAIYEQEVLGCSYGYRPGRGAGDAVRDLTFDLQYGRYGYVVEADIQGFLDTIDHERMMRAVKQHTDCPWVLLVHRAVAESPRADARRHAGQAVEGDTAGGVVSPLLANLFLHYTCDVWMQRHHPDIPFERDADEAVCHCRTEAPAQSLRQELEQRLAACRLELHPQPTKIVYGKDDDRRGTYPHEKFDFGVHVSAPAVEELEGEILHQFQSGGL